jgi:hypothetical protein
VLVLVLFFESGLVGVLVRMDLVVVTVLVLVLGVLVVVSFVSVGVDGFAVPMLVLVCLGVPVLGHRAPFS